MILGIATPGPPRLRIPKLSVPRLRIPKHDHIPTLPLISHILTAIQAVFALIILAFTATTIDHIPASRSIPAFALFVAIATLVIFIYRVATLWRWPAFYNRIVVLAAEVVLAVWWLSAFAALAVWSSARNWGILCGVGTDDEVYCVYRRNGNGLAFDVVRRSSHAGWYGSKYRDCIAAASLGAIEFILSLVTLVIYSVHFHRMRQTGAPYTSTGKWSSPLDPDITPTGLTMEHTIAHPITIGTNVDDTLAPPRIETVSGRQGSEQFVTPAETPERDDEGFAALKRDLENETRLKEREIRHSGSFFIDDGVVGASKLGYGAASKI